jgi:hypothetical protein
MFSLSPVVLTLCFLFFPSSSLPKACSIYTTNCQILKLPDSSWRGWGLSLLLLFLYLLLTESLAIPLFPPLLKSAFATRSESSLGVELDLLRDLLPAKKSLLIQLNATNTWKPFCFSQLTTTCRLREKNNHPTSTAVFQQLYTWVKKSNQHL